MAKKTIKNAVLQTLEACQTKMTYMQVFEYIQTHGLYVWDSAKTPSDTVSAILGDFIRKNDTRVKRHKGSKGFEYYLTKYENDIEFEDVAIEQKIITSTPSAKSKTYHERDLHKLLASYLKTQNIHSKTVIHEKSSRSEEHQRWIHPDMLGIKLIQLKNQNSNALREIIAKKDAFHIYSYELKKTINSDYELKKYFFQAVSNSSWANFGYLVALEIADNLTEELERLNKAFGIGIIELSANVFESRVLFPARQNSLDFQTIDKLCNTNADFEQFIEKSESLLSANAKYFQPALNDFENFCDTYFVENEDDEIATYCRKKHIPYDFAETSE